MSLTHKQYNYLVQPLASGRVQRDGKGMSHLQAWDIRRHLIRIFGFGGFDVETLGVHLISQIEPEKGRYTVVYRADVRLTIKDSDGGVLARYEDSATGDAVNQRSLGDAHDLALKTALSQGLKRCAVNLGDQFGLGLYNKGNMDAVVLGSLTGPTEQAVAADEATEVAGGEEDIIVASDPATAAQISAQIAAAVTRDELAAAWRRIATELRAATITPSAAEILREEWEARKPEIQLAA
jgi:hypothetical protein